MKKHMYWIITAVIVLLMLIFWISALIKCEILTHNYYDDFALAYTENTMLGEMEYFKVLKCDGKTAEVYYVEKEMLMAHVLTFENQNGSWVETSWWTVWSSIGSASEVIYPYWWHFIYGGI